MVSLTPQATQAGSPLEASDSRNAFIDVLRGIAIIGVIFHHLFSAQLDPRLVNFDVGGVRVYPLFFNNGWLGVNLFFILSGFVLYRPGIAADAKHIVAYYIARATRLWPLLFIFVTFVCVIEMHSPYKFVGYVVLYLSGLNSILPRSWMSGAIVWVLWSLGIEILFSLALPALLIAARRFSLARVLLAVAAFCLVYRIVGDHLWFLREPGYANADLNPFKDNIFGRLDDFLFGMAAAELARARRFAPGRGLAWIAAGVLVLTLFGWSYVGAAERTLGVSVLVSVLHTSFAVSVAVLIVHFIRFRVWGAPSFLPLVICGQLCYSLYLFHAFFYKYTPPEPTIAGVVVYLAITFATAAAFFVYVESAGIRRMPAWTKPFGLRR